LRRNIGEDSGRLANLVSQLAKLGVNEMPGVTPKNNCLVGTPDDFYNLLRIWFVTIQTITLKNADRGLAADEGQKMARERDGYQKLPKVTNFGVAPYIPPAIKASVIAGYTAGKSLRKLAIKFRLGRPTVTKIVQESSGILESSWRNSDVRL
jgi:hypothetical protein